MADELQAWEAETKNLQDELDVFLKKFEDIDLLLNKANEATTRANISALVLAGKYDEAKKVSKSFFGLESYALSLITATARRY